MKLIGLLYGAGRVDPAIALVDRVLAVLDRDQVDPANRSICYQYRYQERWKAGDRAGALDDLGRAMDLAEEVRASALGSEFDRARAFGQFGGVFETMVASRIVLADVAGAFAASERGRARSLQDQLELTGVDLLRGLPPAEADRLRRLDLESRARISALQRQVESPASAPGGAAARPSEAIQAELVRAQRDYLNIYRELRDTSPAYRLAVARDRRPVGPEEVRRFVARNEALLLDYVVGQLSASLIVIPPDGPARGLPLVATPEQARRLGIEPGLMTGPKLARALAKVQEAGLSRRPGDDREAAAARDGLAALWVLLIPASERKRLTDGRLKRLIIVPDGPISLLPFEALVVRPGDDPRYLLDVGPPIVYAPSVGILMNLAARPRAPVPADREPVLAVGDPSYPVSDANAGAVLAQRSATGSQYDARGGRLTRLPFSGQEARWVARVFDRDGIKAGTLTGPQATEAAVRHWSPGRRVLHLACHGVVDDSVGNIFGALALTPGPAVATDPADDGFLTMTELSELDLRTCELTILSACRTNFGPQEVGEGVWALSRGFLVAGSRRVVASNWLVDDEAAASLVSYFCAGLAQAEKAGQPVDHAVALQAAKRWARQQDRWKDPYYWASMVLVGPP
jgi:CHAT domain-containing protein